MSHFLPERLRFATAHQREQSFDLAMGGGAGVDEDPAAPALGLPVSQRTVPELRVDRVADHSGDLGGTDRTVVFIVAAAEEPLLLGRARVKRAQRRGPDFGFGEDVANVIEARFGGGRGRRAGAANDECAVFLAQFGTGVVALP